MQDSSFAAKCAKCCLIDWPACTYEQVEVSNGDGGESAKAGARISAVVTLLMSMGAELISASQRSDIAPADDGLAAKVGSFSEADEDDFDDFEEATDGLNGAGDKLQTANATADETGRDTEPDRSSLEDAELEAQTEIGDRTEEQAQTSTSGRDGPGRSPPEEKRSADVEHVDQPSGAAESSEDSGRASMNGRRASVDLAARERCLKVCHLPGLVDHGTAWHRAVTPGPILAVKMSVFAAEMLVSSEPNAYSHVTCSARRSPSQFKLFTSTAALRSQTWWRAHGVAD